MTIKNHIPFLIFTALSIAVMTLSGCTKDPLPGNLSKPTLNAQYKDVSFNSVRLTCNISKTNFKEYGFWYGTKSNLSDKKAVSANLSDDKKYAEASISNLESGKTYYFQAYVNSGTGPVSTSSIQSFTTNVPVSGISLNETSLSLAVGSDFTLTATVSPSNASDKTVIWSSSDTYIAVVSNGTVRAMAVGTTTIKARAGDKTATCTVTVYVPVSEVSIIPSSITLTVGESFTLSAKVSPENATYRNVTWSSSNTSVATVYKGTVKTVAEGMSTITAKTEDKSSTCMVTVVKNFEPEAVDLGLSVKWANCNVGAKKPEEDGYYFAWGETKPKTDYSWSTYKWATSTYDTYSKYNFADNETTLDMSDDAARVNWGSSWRMPTSGEFQELKDNCTWTWTTLDGKNGYRVTSNNNGNSIFLPAAGYNFYNDILNDNLWGYYWSSSSLDKYLSFDSSGGTSPSRYQGCSVRPVYVDLISVTRVSLDRTSLTLAVGSSATLTATVSPSNASEKTVTWSSSNTSVATVSNGTIKAVAAGTATITAMAGNKTATCKVTVEVPVSSVSLSYTSFTLTEGESFTLTATVSPSNATNKTVSWSSSNTSVATVSNGSVRAVAAGTVTITAKAGDKTATCKVTVNASETIVDKYTNYYGKAENNIYWYEDKTLYSSFNGPRLLVNYSNTPRLVAQATDKPNHFILDNVTTAWFDVNPINKLSIAPTKTDSTIVFNAIKDYFMYVASVNDKAVPYLKFITNTGAGTFGISSVRADMIEFAGIQMKKTNTYLESLGIHRAAAYDNKAILDIATPPDATNYVDAFTNLIELFNHYVHGDALTLPFYTAEDANYTAANYGIK